MNPALALAFLLALTLAAGGCAHEMKFPASRFNPPETRGTARPPAPEGEPPMDTAGNTVAERAPIGRIAPLVIQTAHAVSLFPRYTSNGTSLSTESLDYTAPTASYSLLAELALDDRWDLGVRVPFGGPFMVRARRLLSGEPGTGAAYRKLVISASAGLGFGISDTGVDTVDSQGGTQREANLSYTGITADLGFSAGYRFWKRTLFWIEPHLKFDSVSASLEFADDTSLNEDASGSGLLWGVSLGSRFEWEKLFLMLELTWARGKFDGQDGVGFFPGLALGADL